ncbi:MAG: 2Fe-2S iron-sulfur cluster-binding protein, partial [Anaerolineales bacterium]
MAFIVDFQPVGRRGEFSDQETLLECARHLGVDLVSLCGGQGSCSRCRVQLVSGQLSALSFHERSVLTQEEVQLGLRLACKAQPLSNVTIHVPPESLTAPQRTQVEGLDVEINPDPLILTIDLALTPPTLESASADEKNLKTSLLAAGVAQCELDYLVMQSLPTMLRQNNWQVR